MFVLWPKGMGTKDDKPQYDYHFDAFGFHKAFSDSMEHFNTTEAAVTGHLDRCSSSPFPYVYLSGCTKRLSLRVRIHT
jgi:hypothetical protein